MTFEWIGILAGPILAWPEALASAFRPVAPLNVSARQDFRVKVSHCQIGGIGFKFLSKGAHCESKLSGGGKTSPAGSLAAGRPHCPARYCLNGGTCFVDSSFHGAGSPDCNCPPGFNGARCQKSLSSPSRPSVRSLSNPAKHVRR